MQWTSLHNSAVFELLNAELPHLLYGVLQRRGTVQFVEEGKEDEGIRCQVLFLGNLSSYQSLAFAADTLP